MSFMRTAVLIALLGLTAASGWTEPLKVVLSAERTKYAISDRLTIQVVLVNASEEPISVYRILQWGYAGGFVLHVYDEKGDEVHLRAYDDSIAIPSTLNKPDSYVTLDPDHLLGILRTDKLADWELKPGSYTLQVEYRSPVPQSYRKDARFWSRDKGPLRSNSVPLQILP